MTIHMTKHGDWGMAVRIEDPEGTPVVWRIFSNDTNARIAVGMLTDTLEHLGLGKPSCVTDPPKPAPKLDWNEW